MAASWTCHAAKDLALDTETAWDGSAAAKALLDAANIGADNPNFAQARRGFLLVDDSAKELRGSYSLPFATVKSGTLTALISGCRAAASRLPQKDAVSDSERAKARAVLDAYFAKASAKKASPEPDGGFLAFPLRVMDPYDRAQAGSGDDELLNLAKQSAQDPSVFEEFPPFFFSGVVSNNQLDAYYTRMHKSSLENFAGDLNEGVSLQDSHNTRKLGFGYSLRGRYVGAGGDGQQRAIGDFFSLPADPETQGFIQKLRASAVRDLSVGFYLGADGRYVCDLCGNDVMSRSCSHYPGMLYPESEKEGAALVRATATIHGARLAEVSAVYDGATPGAGILKARRMAAAGLLVPDLARQLETCYRIHLPAAHHAWPGADLEPPEERTMPDDPITPPAETPPPAAPFGTPALRALMEAAGLPPGESDEHNLRSLTEAVRQLPAIQQERERLAALADLGRSYHVDLLEATLAEGVRAQGNSFPLETQRTLLTAATIEQLKTLKAAYTEQAKERLAGGRVTTETGEPDPNGSRSQRSPDEIPAAAFRTR